MFQAANCISDDGNGVACELQGKELRKLVDAIGDSCEGVVLETNHTKIPQLRKVVRQGGELVATRGGWGDDWRQGWEVVSDCVWRNARGFGGVGEGALEDGVW